MTIKIYLKYKAEQAAEAMGKFAGEFSRPRTYIYVYLGLALGLVAANMIGGQNISYAYLAYPFVFMIGIWAWLDYRSGRHMYWHKKANSMPTKSDIRKMKSKIIVKDKEEAGDVEDSGAGTGQPGSNNGG